MPLVQNPSIGAGGAPLLVTTASLTSAQILALNATPVAVIPAPGPNKIQVVFGVVMSYTMGSVDYTPLFSDSLTMSFANDSGTTLITTVDGLLSGGRSGVIYSEGTMNRSATVTPLDINVPVTLIANFPYTGGAITSASVGAAGTGYAVGDTGTIEDGSDDATYIVTSIGALGAVTGFNVTAGGTFYGVENGVPTVTGGAQPGIGTGFTVNITAVQTGNGTLKVTSYYQIYSVP